MFDVMKGRVLYVSVGMVIYKEDKIFIETQPDVDWVKVDGILKRLGLATVGEPVFEDDLYRQDLEEVKCEV